MFIYDIIKMIMGSFGVLLIFAAVGIAVGAISGETVWLFLVLAAVLLLFPWILHGLGELAGVILHAVQKV